MKMKHIIGAVIGLIVAGPQSAYSGTSYTVVDTGQIYCYNSSQGGSYPGKGSDYFGQDASYIGNQPAYSDNGDGTVSDDITGLMWQKSPGSKMTLSEAIKAARKCKTGGYKDWRIPTIKELYSLILFTGTDPDPMASNTSQLIPFIDSVFDFEYGNPRNGERIIDSQYGSSTKYVSTTMNGDPTLFGVNFADGRIKGYGLSSPRTGQAKKFFFMFVRGNKDYGKNKFKDNKDGTISDHAIGLTWMKVDSGKLKAGHFKDGKMNWQQALEWSENLEYAGQRDWRLPNVKELQSLVDYKRSPKTTRSAAINPMFKISKITDEGGKSNYPFYWTSSTHVSTRGGSAADYICFGEALGWMKDRRTGKYTLMDVHGAGSQRSDPKSGDPADYPHGHGPQGDVIRIGNMVMCVRGGVADVSTSGPKPIQRSKRQTKYSNQQAPQANGFIGRLDKDGDGKVSKSEFDGPQNHFGKLDRDGDGYLSNNEAPTGPPPRRR